MIEEAVFHGGDGGGPYYVNQKGLVESMQKYLKSINLDKVLEIKTKNHIPYFSLRDEFNPLKK